LTVVGSYSVELAGALVGSTYTTTTQTVSGTGAIVLSGANTYTGSTTIGSGTLQIGNGGTTGSLSTSSAITNNGALVFNRSDTVTQGTHFSTGGISGSGSLTQAGNGTLVLNATNTYDGATTVNAGNLQVAGSIANSAATVSNAGTTIASGATGILGSSLTINSGAILAAGGAAAAGTATVIGATTLNNGSIFSWDISSNGTGYDKLITASLAGDASPGDAVFRIVAADSTFANTFWNQSRTWTDIFTTDGSNAISDWAGLFTVAVVNSSFQTVSPVNGSFSVSGSTLTWSAVPEVSNVLVGGLLGLGMLRRRRDGGGNLLPRKVTSRSSLHN
jgi:autotransporter-associated beta strand protein